jgi:hypothetical protein
MFSAGWKYLRPGARTSRILRQVSWKFGTLAMFFWKEYCPPAFANHESSSKVATAYLGRGGLCPL